MRARRKFGYIVQSDQTKTGMHVGMLEVENLANLAKKNNSLKQFQGRAAGQESAKELELPNFVACWYCK